MLRYLSKKEVIFNTLLKELKKENGWDTDNSTSAITIKAQKENGTVLYSYDITFVFISLFTQKMNILRRMEKSNYVWEELPEYKNLNSNLKIIKEKEKVIYYFHWKC